MARKNSFPTFKPTSKANPPVAGFVPAATIKSSEINTAVYMSYNFVNSFVNALIANGQSTDENAYVYDATNLSTLIKSDMLGWMINTVQEVTFSGIIIGNKTNKFISIEPDNVEYKDTSDTSYNYTTWMYPKYFAIEKTDKTNKVKSASELYSDKLTFDDKDGDTSELTYAHLVFSTNNNDDTGTYTGSSISFHTSEGYTSTYGTSGITLNDSDGKMEITTTGIKTTAGLFSYNAYVDANNKPTFVSKLSNGNTVSINPVPAVAFNNIYSGFTALNGVYTKEFTYTSATKDNADSEVSNFIISSGLTVITIVAKRYVSSGEYYIDTPVFAYRGGTSMVSYVAMFKNSDGSVSWSPTTLAFLYGSGGNMIIKVLCN